MAYDLMEDVDAEGVESLGFVARFEQKELVLDGGLFGKVFLISRKENLEGQLEEGCSLDLCCMNSGLHFGVPNCRGCNYRIRLEEEESRRNLLSNPYK